MRQISITGNPRASIFYLSLLAVPQRLLLLWRPSPAVCVFTSSWGPHLSIHHPGFLCGLLFPHPRNPGTSGPGPQLLFWPHFLISCILLSKALGKSFKLIPSATTSRWCWCFRVTPPALSAQFSATLSTWQKQKTLTSNKCAKLCYNFRFRFRKREHWQRLQFKMLPVGKEVEFLF